MAVKQSKELPLDVDLVLVLLKKGANPNYINKVLLEVMVPHPYAFTCIIHNLDS